MDDRRAHPRIQRSIEAIYIEPVTGLGGLAGRKQHVEIADISMGGCFIAGLAPPVRSRCRLLLTLEGSRVVGLDAEIVRVEHQNGCGAQFLALTGPADDAIRRAVSGATA